MIVCTLTNQPTNQPTESPRQTDSIGPRLLAIAIHYSAQSWLLQNTSHRCDRVFMEALRARLAGLLTPALPTHSLTNQPTDRDRQTSIGPRVLAIEIHFSAHSWFYRTHRADATEDRLQATLLQVRHFGLQVAIYQHDILTRYRVKSC